MASRDLLSRILFLMNFLFAHHSFSHKRLEQREAAKPHANFGF